MTDIASLGIAIDSTSAVNAVENLEAMVPAGSRAEAAMKQLEHAGRVAMMGLLSAGEAADQLAPRLARLRGSVDPFYNVQRLLNNELHEAAMLYHQGALSSLEYASAVRVLEDRLKNANAAQQTYMMSQGRMGNTMRLTANEALNLSRQFSDIGVTLAMGMNPLMIAVQQGPQIADIFQTAAQRGMGFSAVLTAIGAQLAPILAFLAPFAAAIAAIGVAVGAVWGVLTVAADRMNATTGDLTDNLKLTEEQLKKVKDTGVTAGDVLAGSWDYVSGKFMEFAGPTLTEVGEKVGGFFDDCVNGVIGFVNAAVGGFGYAVGAIQASWSLIPGLIKYGMSSAANFVLSTVEKMVNGFADGLNAIKDILNAIAAISGNPLRVGDIGRISLDRVQQEGEVTGEAFAAAMVSGGERGKAAALAALGQMAEDIAAAARKRAIDRIIRESGMDTDPSGKDMEGVKPDKGSKDKEGKSEAERAIETAIKNAEKAVQTAEEQAASQGRLNDQLAAGTITQAQLNQQMAIENAIRPILAAAAEAEGEDKAKLLSLAERLAAATATLNAEKLRGEMITANSGRQDELARIEREIELVGASNEERAVQLALLKEEQAWRNKGFDPTTATAKELEAYNNAINSAKELAAANVNLQQTQHNYNEALEATLVLLTGIEQRANAAASGLSSAFDGLNADLKRVVSGIGSVMNALTKMWTREEAIERERAKAREAAGDDAVALARIDSKAAAESAQNRISSYASMAEAGKSFFEENTAGYKVMQAAQIAFRTIEMLMSIRAIAQASAEAAANAAAAGTTASAWGIAAFARTLASLPFPFNLAAGATVLAALAAVGVMISGGGSASGSSIAGDRQDRQGAGTILGDTKAKSDSIANSLEIVAANTNRDLEYSNAMVKALRSIDNQIGVVAAALGRSLGVGGIMDTSKLGLGKSTEGPGLMTNLLTGGISMLLPGLFATTVKKTLMDIGVSFKDMSLDAILSGGLTGEAYAVIQKETKKKFLGMTYSDKVSTKTKYTDLDAEFLQQTALLIQSIKDGIVTAAGVIGVEGAAEMLAGFQVSLGKISFKDMSADEIEKALENVFSKLADQMTGAVVPQLKEFQKAGEGLFETLIRVARQYQVIDVTLNSIGMTFGSVGLASLAAREHLIGLFESLDQFVEQTQFFAENFMSEAERLAPVQAAVTAELARLNLGWVDTREEFKNVVLGLDLSTAAGAEMYAALMALAPAFALITEEMEAVADAKNALAEAYDREASALEETADRFRQIAESLDAYGQSLISGPSAQLSPEAQYLAAKAEFERIQALAATGDVSALEDLQGVSQAYLDASEAYYASSAGYFADLEAVRAAVEAAEQYATDQVNIAELQLAALETLVGQYIDLNENVLTVAEAIQQLIALQSGTVATTTTGGEPGSSAPATDGTSAGPSPTPPPPTPPGPPPPPPITQADIDQAVNNVATSPEQIAKLQGIIDEIGADKIQRAAIANQTLRSLTTIEDYLARQLRETTAA